MLDFLPANKYDLSTKGWNQLDIIIITGDAYIDHPGFGTALIGRYLESHGYKVGILPQPDWNNLNNFKALGKPNLYFAVTAGNMDSMVNKYTARKKIRTYDAYSPNGHINKRPDRATIVYSQKIKRIFPDIPIIIGGIEASLRRIPHYDYWSDKLRNSILFDSRADILVYGMAEKSILTITKLIESGKNVEEIKDVPGTVVSVKEKKLPQNSTVLPEFKKEFTPKNFFEMTKRFYNNYLHRVLYQKFAHRYLKHNPPSAPLTEKEIDKIYELPFSYKPHPQYKNKPIKAYEQIKNSITSHRGCFGGCNFCAIALHQGKTIQSRSQKSIQNTIQTIINKDSFNGTITDIGGPTANMYGMSCKKGISKTCSRDSCLMPEICKNLDYSHQPLLEMLKNATEIQKVKHLFVASGIRHDLALKSRKYIENLVKYHVSGLLKLAPEHKSSKILQLMNKPAFSIYQNFFKKFHNISEKMVKNQTIVPYIIVGHPGATLHDTLELAVFLKKRGIKLKQVQEFTPTPMTKSTMMYYTGRDWYDSKIHIPKGREKRLQKAIVQWFKSENKKLIIEALKKIDRMDLISFFLD